MIPYKFHSTVAKFLISVRTRKRKKKEGKKNKCYRFLFPRKLSAFRTRQKPVMNIIYHAWGRERIRALVKIKHYVCLRCDKMDLGNVFYYYYYYKRGRGIWVIQCHCERNTPRTRNAPGGWIRFMFEGIHAKLGTKCFLLFLLDKTCLMLACE